mmetsp:Transcript_4309/g.12817  ORF Transcript_4309/g.12817 Transcript_4309/m.12817 type:complete len:235 (-) Transcript_4309:1113-1817(-)
MRPRQSWAPSCGSESAVQRASTSSAALHSETSTRHRSSPSCGEPAASRSPRASLWSMVLRLSFRATCSGRSGAEGGGAVARATRRSGTGGTTKLRSRRWRSWAAEVVFHPRARSMARKNGVKPASPAPWPSSSGPPSTSRPSRPSDAMMASSSASSWALNAGGAPTPNPAMASAARLSPPPSTWNSRSRTKLPGGVASQGGHRRDPEDGRAWGAAGGAEGGEGEGTGADALDGV